jgi:hypothetical protein
MLEMTSVGVTAGIVLHLTIERPILALRNLPLNFKSACAPPNIGWKS